MAALTGAVVESDDCVAALPRMPVVAPVAALTGLAGADRRGPSPAGFIEALLLSACGGDVVPDLLTAPVLATPGGWACRFRVGHPAARVEALLDAVKVRSGAAWNQSDGRTYTVTKSLGPPGWGLWAGKRGRAEVTLRLPATAAGEAELAGTLAGPAGGKTDPTDPAAVRGLMEELRDLLRDGADRRRAFRVPTDCPVRLYPVTKTGRVSAPVGGRCRNLSAGGFRADAAQAVPAGFVYVEFPGGPATDGFALLARVVRVEVAAAGVGVAGEFFTAD